MRESTKKVHRALGLIHKAGPTRSSFAEFLLGPWAREVLVELSDEGFVILDPKTELLSLAGRGLDRLNALNECSVVWGADLPAVEIPAMISLGEVERQYIVRCLADHKGNRTRTAETLGIGRNTLIRKLGQYESGA